MYPIIPYVAFLLILAISRSIQAWQDLALRQTKIDVELAFRGGGETKLGDPHVGLGTLKTPRGYPPLSLTLRSGQALVAVASLGIPLSG
jgi:hypothetical protein